MLDKRSKSISRLILFLSATLAILLVVSLYFSINKEIITANAILASEDSQANSMLSRISKIITAQTIFLIVFFATAMLSIEYLLGWYFIENKNALLDELTEIYNRKGINRFLKKESSRAKRFKHPLSIAMIDIDHFKNYNDTLGHQAGDEALRTLGRVLKSTVRDEDIVSRYGGEEFCIILPGISKQDISPLGERVRRIIELHQFYKERVQPEGRITVSLGGSTYPDDAKDGDELVLKADQALYKAKNHGRNKLVLFNKNLKKFQESISIAT